MQRDAETDCNRPSAMFAYAVQVAVLELRKVRNDASALAAENAGLKEWNPNPHSASMFEAIEKAEKLMDDGMPELAMIEAFEILKMNRTPATDAFLAEVRAQGVDSAINTVIAMMNHQHPVTSKAIDILRVHADQIRKGSHS